jgi:hypothetical protein
LVGRFNPQGGVSRAGEGARGVTVAPQGRINGDDGYCGCYVNGSFEVLKVHNGESERS